MQGRINHKNTHPITHQLRNYLIASSLRSLHSQTHHSLRSPQHARHQALTHHQSLGFYRIRTHSNKLNSFNNNVLCVVPIVGLHQPHRHICCRIACRHTRRPRRPSPSIEKQHVTQFISVSVGWPIAVVTIRVRHWHGGC